MSAFVMREVLEELAAAAAQTPAELVDGLRTWSGDRRVLDGFRFYRRGDGPGRSQLIDLDRLLVEARRKFSELRELERQRELDRENRRRRPPRRAPARIPASVLRAAELIRSMRMRGVDPGVAGYVFRRVFPDVTTLQALRAVGAP